MGLVGVGAAGMEPSLTFTTATRRGARIGLDSGIGRVSVSSYPRQ